MACDQIILLPRQTIRKIASVTSNIVSVFPAAEYGPLYYRALEEFKIKALKQNKGNFGNMMPLTDGALTELEWWSQNALNFAKEYYDYVIATDASKLGWGAVLGESSTNGTWSTEETALPVETIWIF
eukprot:gene935-246_t